METKVTIEEVISKMVEEEISFDGFLEHNDKTYQIHADNGVVLYCDLEKGQCKFDIKLK